MFKMPAYLKRRIYRFLNPDVVPSTIKIMHAGSGIIMNWDSVAISLFLIQYLGEIYKNLRNGMQRRVISNLMKYS